MLKDEYTKREKCTHAHTAYEVEEMYRHLLTPEARVRFEKFKNGDEGESINTRLLDIIDRLTQGRMVNAGKPKQPWEPPYDITCKSD